MFTFLGLFLACSSSVPTGPAAPEKRTIAVIPKGTTHEFWKAVHAGALEAEKELPGYEIVWKGPMRENDREGQIGVVEDFVTRGVAGIVLAPLDDVALKAPVNEALRNGIPTVVIDSALQGDDPVSFIATDNRAGGRTAGERLAQRLGGKGRVVLLRYLQGSASTTEREEGFLEAMAAHPEITVVSSNQFGGPGTDESFQVGERLLTANTDASGALGIDGVFCPNESTTFGMLRALQDGKVAGKVLLVGFDSTEKLLTALRAGEIDALMVQDPHRMGYLGVKAVADKLEGRPVERTTPTASVLVTKDNLADPAIAALVAPPG